MTSDSKKPHFTSSSQVLQSIFKDGKSGLSQQFLRWNCWARWAEVVGDVIAQNTEPVHYQRGTLYIWVKSSVWLQQLYFLSPQLKQKINKEMKCQWVERLQFTLDRKSLPEGDESIQHLQKEFSKKIDDNS